MPAGTPGKKEEKEEKEERARVATKERGKNNIQEDKCVIVQQKRQTGKQCKTSTPDTKHALRQVFSTQLAPEQKTSWRATGI